MDECDLLRLVTARHHQRLIRSRKHLAESPTDVRRMRMRGKKPIKRRPRAQPPAATAKRRRTDAERPAKYRRVGPGLDVIDDFAALRVMHSNGGNAGALRQMEVFEWVGDAVIGELVARCLLSQFHHSPLSARVFRNLRLGAVTNQNLASVFDLIGYQRNTFEARKRKTKEKADVVEAVAGEIVVRLELQKRDERVCAQLRSHLDAVMAAMLHQHFAERRRVHQKAVLAGPLKVSFNAFDCLPQEDLDEETGELVVRDGSLDAVEKQIVRDTEGNELSRKSFADLIEECEHDDKPRAPGSSSRFHSLGDQTAVGLECEDASYSWDEPTRQTVLTIYKRFQLKLRLVNAEHVLRSSQEIFDVFKIYGMTVLAERVSSALAFPFLAFHKTAGGGSEKLVVSPSSLTAQRQSVLCMSNMERCAVLLGLTADEEREDDDLFAIRRRRANTLRAFVGYHSAIVAEDGVRSIVDDVTYLLQLVASSQGNDRDLPRPSLQSTPRREPLVVLVSAVNEATDFMTSPACADLHQPGERPQPTAAPKLLLRKCDSEVVEDLFETLARRTSESDKSRKASDADETNQRRRKRKRSEDQTEAEANQGKPSANLSRFSHRRFLFCLEELVVLFAQRRTEECRAKMVSFELDLEPCAGEFFRKWEVSTSTLTIAMRDSFHRLLLHDLCHFHALVSTSKNTRDGTRITQLRLPLHYTWAKVQRRVTTEEEATTE